MILTQSYFLLTDGWRMFLTEGPLVDTTKRERLQLITRENGKSLSKSNQHVRKAHYGGFLLLNVNDVNVNAPTFKFIDILIPTCIQSLKIL